MSEGGSVHGTGCPAAGGASEGRRGALGVGAQRGEPDGASGGR